MKKARMKGWLKAGAIGLALALGGCVLPLRALAAQKSAIPQQKTYQFETPALTGDQSGLLMQNPDRGLRLEVNMDVATGMGLWNNTGSTGIEQLRREAAYYATDQPRLAQVYFYLHGYKDRDLDETAFANMDAYFEVLKELDIKAVFRFAYIWDETSPGTQEPSVAQTVRHLEQLKPYLEKWQPQIHVLQAGIIGAWGEWDANARARMNNQSVGGKRGETAILHALLENSPADMYVQVRYLNIKNNNLDVSSPHWNRVGYHDDYIIGELHGWNTAGNNPSSAGWQQMTEESAQLLIDGEMIWGSANGSDHGGRTINSVLVAQRLLEHHFTSLSLTHNYKEQDGEYSMLEWQREYVNRNILATAGLPFHSSWFVDAQGNVLPRTMFEYIRDHLGYYLVAQDASAVVDGTQVTASLTVANYGFAAPLGLADIRLVLLDADGNEAAAENAFALGSLQPGASVNAEVSLEKTDADRAYRLAISARARGGEAARFANDLEFSNGYIILGDLY